MQHDLIVIGGSFAGLSAALTMARSLRSVCVVDAGVPRNRFASEAHGIFAQDGSKPETMLATARLQVAAYPSVAFVETEAVAAAREPEGFSVTLASGETLQGSKLLFAFGISDELPALPGLAERWGHSALHCPYCHGYEFRGGRLAVLGVSPVSILQALMVAEWGATTLYLNGLPAPDDASLAQLREHGIALEESPVTALHGRGKQLSSLLLADGREVPADALYLAPPTRLNSEIAAHLGCDIDEGSFGPVVRSDAEMMTSVPGVYAAGDITRDSHHSVTLACADGVTAALAIHASLVFPDSGSP